MGRVPGQRIFLTTIATNKKAYHNYFLMDKWECGHRLEQALERVKSIRAGGASFTDAFAHIDKGELYLYNLHINPYEQASYLNQEPARLTQIAGACQGVGAHHRSIDPQRAYPYSRKLYFNKRGWVKVEIAVRPGQKLIRQARRHQKTLRWQTGNRPLY